jgi:hypothetical protein
MRIAASVNLRHIISEYACLQFSLNVKDASTVKEMKRIMMTAADFFIDSDSIQRGLLYVQKSEIIVYQSQIRRIKKAGTIIPAF